MTEKDFSALETKDEIESTLEAAAGSSIAALFKSAKW